MRHALLALVAVASVACVPPPIAPHMQAAGRVPLAKSGRAKVVFLWAENSCERGGFYTVATRDGRFLGNLYADTRLETELPPGPVDFMAFNPLVEEAEGGATSADVAPLHAELAADRTYFVRFAFGEWDERGPVGPRIARSRGGMVHVLCPTNEAALIALTPRSPEWPQLRDWLDELDPVRSHGAQGDAWLREDPDTLDTHRALVATRERRLHPIARQRATLLPTDGVHVITGVGALARGGVSPCADAGTLCL